MRSTQSRNKGWKKSWQFAIVSIVAALFCLSAMGEVQARGGIEVQQKKRGGGGEIPLPFPFSKSNQNVELADGSIYTLLGHIRIADGYAYFEVDLKAHPWLQNHRRSLDTVESLYPLIADRAVDWESLENKYVRISVLARGRVVEDYDGFLKHEIVLYSKLDPVRVTRKKPKKPR